MIIIKIIILYFIQIRHTDDFTSTGTRLVPITVPMPDNRNGITESGEHSLCSSKGGSLYT